MAHRVLVINPKDNIAVALTNIPMGHSLDFKVRGKTMRLLSKQNVPRGHKIAIDNISKGEAVIKYGEIVGYATRDIHKGEFVHVHNLAGRDEAR
jgi:altronate dehydratase small subunit